MEPRKRCFARRLSQTLNSARCTSPSSILGMIKAAPVPVPQPLCYLDLLSGDHSALSPCSRTSTCSGTSPACSRTSSAFSPMSSPSSGTSPTCSQTSSACSWTSSTCYRMSSTHSGASSAWSGTSSAYFGMSSACSGSSSVNCSSLKMCPLAMPSWEGSHPSGSEVEAPVIVSWNGLGWKGPQRSSHVNPPTKGWTVGDGQSKCRLLHA